MGKKDDEINDLKASMDFLQIKVFERDYDIVERDHKIVWILANLLTSQLKTKNVEERLNNLLKER